MVRKATPRVSTVVVSIRARIMMHDVEQQLALRVTTIGAAREAWAILDRPPHGSNPQANSAASSSELRDQ